MVQQHTAARADSTSGKRAGVLFLFLAHCPHDAHAAILGLNSIAEEKSRKGA